MQLRGEGSMTGRNLIVVSYPNNITKDGKTRYADVQLDSRDEFAAGQTNLHAVTRRDKDKDGNERFTNGAAYSVDQYALFKAKGKTQVQPNGAEVTILKGSVMPATRGSGLIINTKAELGESDFDLHDKIIDDQFASVAAAKAAAEAKGAEVEAEPEVETEAALEEPEV